MPTAISTSAPSPSPAPPSTPTLPPAALTPNPTLAATPTPDPSCVPVTGFDAIAVQAARDSRASVICFPAGRYTGEVPANVPGQTWSLDPNAVLTWRVWVQADGVTIRGGRIEQGLTDPYSQNVTILGGSHVTIENMVIVGEGRIGIHGSDFNRVRNNKLVGPGCGSIFLSGGAADGADDNLIEGNGLECGMIGSLGSDGRPPLVFNRRNIVRNNTIKNSGWMAVEFIRSPETLIEGNTLAGHHVAGGGGTIVSLPVSDSSIVRGNTLISLSGDWGVELAGSNDVTVESNDIYGTVLSPSVAAINHNSGSARSIIRLNRVHDYSVFVDLGPRSTVTDNCLTNVPVLFRYDDGMNTLAGNGPC
jgi:parallel beta helix pectate lyase-like protein